MTSPTSPKLSIKLRTQEQALADRIAAMTRDGSEPLEILIQVLSLAEELAKNHKEACQHYEDAEEYAGEILSHINEAQKCLPDAERYYNAAVEEWAVSYENPAR